MPRDPQKIVISVFESGIGAKYVWQEFTMLFVTLFYIMSYGRGNERRMEIIIVEKSV